MRPPSPIPIFALSPAQARQLAGKAGTNVAPLEGMRQIVCSTTEALNLAAFQQAWQTVVNRHDVLGIRIVWDEANRPWQQRCSPIEVPFVVEENFGVRDHEAHLDRWLERDRVAGFDLTVAPLIRITLHHFAENFSAWVFTFHQILFDGRSIMLVLEDFFAGYEALCAGREVVLPERKPFADFIAHHRNWLGARTEAATAHWKKVFAGDESEPILSISRGTSSTEQKVVDLDLGVKFPADLQRLTTDLGVTANNVIQGAWALLLGRYYRSHAVTFATVRACRQGEGVVDGAATMIGSLMNALPVHIRVSSLVTVADFIKGIRADQLAARPYELTSLDIFHRALSAGAGKQFADSCVLYERYNVSAEMTARFGRNGGRHLTLHEHPSVPLLVLATERPESRVRLVYQSGIFEDEEIAVLARSLATLLRQMVALPEAKLASLAPMDLQDRAAVDQMLTGPAVEVDPEKCLHHWFEEQARRTPEAVAVEAEMTLTYGELNRRADELAARLVAQGISPDQVVALYFFRSARALVALLGVLKSGAAYLPLDVDLPQARVKGLLEDAQPPVVITEKALASSLPPSSAPLLLLDELQNAPLPSPAPKPPKVRGHHLAYVIPTSGTTGRPKLTGVEHRQVSNLLTFATTSLLRPEDVRCVPFIDSTSFDSSISQIFTTLSLGGTLVFVADILTIRSSPFYERFTCLGTTPSLLATVLRETGLPPAVQLIGLGAEAIPADLLEKLDRLPQIRRVINYYGPTETTVYCTHAIAIDRSNPHNKTDLRKRGRIIGRPVANTRIYLLDEYGQLAPPGAPGEVCVAGAAVARGYLNSAGRESTAFRPDPFTVGDGRMYCTGDLACLRTDGQLEFLGRRDHQIKFNGVRIETAEIENALLTIPGIRQCVVDLRNDGEGKKRLVAYIVVDAGNFPRQNLRKTLRLLLPGTMIPQHYIALESLPLNSNGKVDRQALSRFELGLETAAATHLFLSPTEEKMKAILEKNLGRNPIGVDQDYFELGGDSLSAVNLLLAIEKTFGVRLTQLVLLDSATISELAREVEMALGPAKPATPARHSIFVALEKSGQDIPIVLIPGGSGESFLSYKNYAKSFFPNHPVYAVQSPYTQMLETPAPSVAAMAGHFAREIIALVGDRPFLLFGHCFGGLLGWHVAGALLSENAPPFRLIIFDAPVARLGANITMVSVATGRESRPRRIIKAYQLAWADWSARHDPGWRSTLGFAFWVLRNVWMRKGWLRTQSGRDSYAKLVYLRALQGCPLGLYPGDALFIFPEVHAAAVSKSLWQSHTTGRIKFEFVPGGVYDWERSIFRTLPMVERALAELDGEKSQALELVAA